MGRWRSGVIGYKAIASKVVSDSILSGRKGLRPQNFYTSGIGTVGCSRFNFSNSISLLFPVLSGMRSGVLLDSRLGRDSAGGMGGMF
jgi:hypothetical protein